MKSPRKKIWKRALRATALGIVAAVALQAPFPGLTTSAEAAAVVQNGENRLSVETGRGIMLRLDRAA